MIINVKCKYYALIIVPGKDWKACGVAAKANILMLFSHNMPLSRDYV